MTDVVITGRKILANAISLKWPGAIVACKYNKVSGDTTVEWHANSPVQVKTAVEIGTSQDEYDLWITDTAAQKTAKANTTLNTPINKTIRDALWEICQAVRGTTPLPSETKAVYTARLKAMLESNLP